MTSITAAPSSDAALRRAVMRLLVVVAVLMLVAGVPRVATSTPRDAPDELLLRDAIARYRAEHGRLPDARTWDELLDQLSQPTDLAGRAGGALGPYLSAAWVRDTEAGPAPGRVVDSLPAPADGTCALLWCRTTGELRRAR